LGERFFELALDVFHGRGHALHGLDETFEVGGAFGVFNDDF